MFIFQVDQSRQWNYAGALPGQVSSGPVAGGLHHGPLPPLGDCVGSGLPLHLAPVPQRLPAVLLDLNAVLLLWIHVQSAISADKEAGRSVDYCGDQPLQSCLREVQLFEKWQGLQVPRAGFSRQPDEVSRAAGET